MIYIFHISNTDISIDSRILKEISSLSNLSDCSIVAVGVSEDNKFYEKNIQGGRLHSLRLWSRCFKWLPRPVRYSFELIEFTFRVIYLVRSFLSNKSSTQCVVHCHDTFSLPIGSLLKHFNCVNVVYDAHELESNKNGQNIILSKATLLIEKICWRDIDLLISVSDSIINWYNSNFSKKNSCLVLNSPFFSLEKIGGKTFGENYLKNKFCVPAGVPLFIYLGILGPGRGIEVCLKVFAAYGNTAHVVFVGSGVLYPLIESFTVNYSNIHIHQTVEHQDVVELASGADFGLCLIENASMSDYYCLPNKLFEYSFAGLGIIGSRFPEIQKVIEKYDLGVVCDPTSEDIFNAISLLSSSGFKRKSGNLQELSWEAQSEKLIQSYAREFLCK